MKLVELTEADVVDIQKPLKSAERKYGVGGYTTLLDVISSRHTDKTGYVRPKLAGTNTQPKVRAMKRPSPQEIRKGLLAVGFPDEELPELSISPRYSNDPPVLAVYPYLYQLEDKLPPEMDSRMRQNWRDRWQKHFIAALAAAFGWYADSVEFSGRFGSPIVILSDKYQKVIGLSASRRRPLSRIVLALFDKHNIGGLRFPWVDKVKSGYRIKIEGAEIIDSNSLKRLEIDIRNTFGEDVNKIKVDKGELQGLGHRPVGPGLTNYRIFFTPDIKGKYPLR